MEKKTSGAHKRKIRQEREGKVKKMQKIDSFLFRKPEGNQNQINPETPKICESSTGTNSDLSTNLITSVIAESIPNIQTLDDTNEIQELFAVTDSHNLDIEKSSDKIDSSKPLNSTDLGYYTEKDMTDDIRRIIISSPSCRPKGPFPKDQNQENRSFSENYYTTLSRYGPISRAWLCYSVILDAAYCEPCWLFSVSKSEWTTTGVRSWKNLSRKILSHSNSHTHVQSCKIYEQWKKNKTIDKELEEKIRYEASFWKMVLDRLFNITLLLAKNSVAFRGHREGTRMDQHQGENLYNGNFLSQVELLSKYDDTMRQVLLMPAGMYYKKLIIDVNILF